MNELIERLRADAELIHNNGITRKLRRHRVAALLRDAAAALEAAREQLDWAVKENDRLLAEGSELTTRAERLAEALLCVLPFAEHSDSCGDHDAYNNAAVPTCGCGLEAIREHADELLHPTAAQEDAQ